MEVDESHLSDVQISELFLDSSGNITPIDEAAAISENVLDPSALTAQQLALDVQGEDGFMGDWDLPEVNITPNGDLEEPDYSKFENWIPLFWRPEEPCAYCKSRRLQCYVQRGEAHCTPCKSLFRECSLCQSNTLEAANASSGTFLDTLHSVDEYLAIDRGTFTGIKAMRSKVANGIAVPARDDAPGSNKRNGIRFPRHAIKLLRDWLAAHASNPYPTETEKVELEEASGLSQTQIANWLANARRKRKAMDKQRPRMCASPSLKATTPAIDIPTGCEKPWNELGPLDRWKNSPPEHGGAAIENTIYAMAKGGLEDDNLSTTPSTLSRRGKGSSAGSAVSNMRAPSITSQETGQTSSLSASSAAFSRGSSRSHSTHGSFGSFSSSLAGKKDRRRRRRTVLPTPTGTNHNDDKKRIFQCTFCTDTFRSKYDWTRHEKSLHISLEKWICVPFGGITSDEATGEKRCSYCSLPDPTEEHLETHNHRQCADKGHDARTFYRKDHLRQHLRLMHGCEMAPAMEAWKFVAVSINSRCGFCGQRFAIWQERVDHLTAHFKAGARMEEWKGCRGLDPAVAAMVTNGMPPYLIGLERKSPNPFSATNRGSWKQAPDIPDLLGTASHSSPDEQELPPDSIDLTGTQLTCWEVLTIHLGRYAKEMAQKGVTMTDEMLQRQARMILYEDDDTWNHTPADNAEWLDLFKKAHGLNFIPDDIGGTGAAIPEDLETYGDLGLRIPFAVQLKAYIDHERPNDPPGPQDKPGPLRQVLNQRRATLKEVYRQLTLQGVLYADDIRCQHPECVKNVIDLTMIDEFDKSAPQLRRWCTADVPKDKVEELEWIVQRVKPQPSTTFDSTISPDTNAAGPVSAATARANSLSFLNSIEAPLFDSCDGQIPMPTTTWAPASTTTGTSCGLAQRDASFIPRHKLSLPDDVATRFSTVTGAWADSGIMPAPIHTSVPTIEETESVSTGAMMEFLGGTFGGHLPFSNDDVSSSIALDGGQGAMKTSEQLQLEPQWQLANGEVVGREGFLLELDHLIQTSTATAGETAYALADAGDVHVDAEHEAMPMMMDVNWTTGEPMPSVPAKQAGLNERGEDLSGLEFDDAAFDGVFDMTMDEDFISLDA